MTETPAEATGRGRPRPDATITRDQVVLDYIRANGPQTRSAIATGTEIKGSEVYLSLYRLSRSDPPQVVRSGSAWAIPGTEVPAEAAPAA